MIKKITVKSIYEAYSIAEKPIEFNAVFSLYDPDSIRDCIMLQNKMIRNSPGPLCEFFVHPMQDTMENQLSSNNDCMSAEEFEKFLEEDDISGLHPSVSKVKSLISNFKKLIDSEKEYNVLIHCHAGISRSTAASIILMYLMGIKEQDAIILAHKIRAAAWPSQLILRIADKILNSDLYSKVLKWKVAESKKPFSFTGDDPVEL